MAAMAIIDAAHIVADAIDKGFIEGVSKEIPGTNTSVDTLCVKLDGRTLIEKTWFIFPTGLWSAWHKENGKGLLALMITIVSLLVSIATLLAKLVFFNKPGM
jgi:hypothetical protein